MAFGNTNCKCELVFLCNRCKAKDTGDKSTPAEAAVIDEVPENGDNAGASKILLENQILPEECQSHEDTTLPSGSAEECVKAQNYSGDEKERKSHVEVIDKSKISLSDGNIGQEDKLPQMRPSTKLPKTDTAHFTSNDFDIGTLDRNCLTDAQKLAILQYRNKKVTLEKDLPVRSFGAKKRKFNPSLLNVYDFLRYSATLDGCFCAPCFVFGFVDPLHSQTILISNPLVDWSNARKILDRHKASKTHFGSVHNSQEFVKVFEGKQDSVYQRISKVYNDKILENRYVLGEIIKIIILCGRQNISLRGHYPDKSNFMAILRHTAEHDMTLKKFLDTAPKNARYLSPQIQNDLLQLIGKQIQNKILQKVRSSKWYGFIADETQDIVRNEQVSIALRYLHKGKNNLLSIHEDFIEFIVTEDTSGRSLANLFLNRLLAYNIDVKFMRAQTYDKGANMCGKLNGVQAVIKETVPQAVYCACMAHGLNTALVHSCSVRNIANLFTTVNQCVKLIKSSAKRHNVYLRELNELSLFNEDDTPTYSLRQATATRWVSEIDCVRRFKNKLIIIISTLEEIAQFDATAQTHVNNVLNFEFLIALNVAEKVLGYTKNLHILLQASNLDLVQAADEASVVSKTLMTIRENSESIFNDLFQLTTNMAESFNVKVNMPRIVKHQINRANADSDGPQQHFLRNLFIPFIDNVLSELNNQIIQSRPRLLAQFLIPSRLDELVSLRRIQTPACIFDGFDRDALYDKEEVENWMTKWKDIAFADKPNTIMDTLNSITYEMYPNIYTALFILACMPISGAVVERSFSVLKRLRTWLRNSMKEERLTALALLAMHHDIDVDVEQVLHEFDPLHDRRILLAFE